MPAATRKGDNCSGHKCFPPRPSSEGSPDVFINGRASVRQGDGYDRHCCGGNCHRSQLAVGSSTVFVNGKPVGRIGDDVACGSVAAVGSSNVFIGG